MSATLEGIIGHQAVLGVLERDLDSGTLPHALLLVGPENVGKTTVALKLADAIVGEWPGGLEAHPDCWIEDTATERIGIDRIRPTGKQDAMALQEFFSRRTYAGGERAAVIARADRLTEQAANALLKTLEEPPLGSHIVLTVANPERLPQTILSRCRTYLLGTVSRDQIAEWLVSRAGIDAKQAKTAATISSGRPGAALLLATEEGALQSQVDALEEFINAPGNDVAGTLALAGRLAPQSNAAGRELAITQLATWASFVRDAICYSQNLPKLALWQDYAEALGSWSKTIELPRLTAILQRITETIDAISVNANPRLAFEVLFLDVFAA